MPLDHAQPDDTISDLAKPITAIAASGPISPTSYTSTSPADTHEDVPDRVEFRWRSGVV
jgi:hypothetical protein